MKTPSQTIRVVVWVLLGLTLTLTSLALSRPSTDPQNTTATPVPATLTVTPEAFDEVGSTDGIMLLAAIIVLIVTLPIILRRQAWSNGKPKK